MENKKCNCKNQCECPPGSQGPTGETGLQGIQGPPTLTTTPAYGYAYRADQMPKEFQDSPIELSLTGPMNDVIFDSTTSSLMVLRTGTYQVQYTVTTILSLTLPAAQTFSSVKFVLLLNELYPVSQYIPEAYHAVDNVVLPDPDPNPILIAQVYPIHASTIVELNIGDKIQIVPYNYTPQSYYQDAYLQIMQIK